MNSLPWEKRKMVDCADTDMLALVHDIAKQAVRLAGNGYGQKWLVAIGSLNDWGARQNG